MRYYSTPPKLCKQVYGETYRCNHPVYNKCTLFKDGERGLAVIQQKYDKIHKYTWWTRIEPWLANRLYLDPDFRRLIKERAKEPVDGLYPTITVRQAMWAIRMKPLKKERWETVFDRKDI